jgi:glutamyl-tRNA reductase
VADRFGGQVVSLDELPEQFAAADMVVASTASPHPIVGAVELELVMRERRGRPLLLIDLAVPRDIDPACAELPGVTLLDVDGLQRQVARHQLGRQTEARKAEGIVEDEIQAFAGWLGSLEVMPTLTALRTRADDVVSGLLKENEGRWESLSAADRERVEKLARTAVSRLLHEPTVRVRQLDAEHRHARLSLLRELFGLDEQPATAESAEGGEVRPLRRRGAS